MSVAVEDMRLDEQEGTAKNFWETRWVTGSTRWDQGIAHPVLLNLLNSEKGRELIPSSGTAVVPACGRGYDVQALAEYGLNTTGVELSPTGLQEAEKWLSSQSKAANGSTKMVQADFFEWAKKSTTPKADVLLDYTFLCALHPSFRSKWVASLSAIASKSPPATLITLMFPLNVPRDKEEGPPFPLSVELYHELLDEKWELVYLEDIDRAGGKGRTTGPHGEEKLGVWKYRT